MYKKLECCKYCSISFESFGRAERANHTRWCIQNPKRPEYVAKNNASQLQTAASIKKRTAGIKKAWEDGKYDHVDHSSAGWQHTDKTKEILRQKALASPHRRLVRSVRSYTQKDGTVVQLDSAWEEALAKRLDATGVTWSRPPAIKWIDAQGTQRNYFPDFYLPNYDMFLDPKNPYAIKAQIDKIKCLTEQVKNLIILKSLDECKNFSPDQGLQWHTQ
jgi:hypothetical protein